MQLKTYIREVPAVAARIGVNVPKDWNGIDSVMPVIDRICEDGGVFILKFDGARVREDDTGQFTVIVSGTPLGDESIRIDAKSLEEALAFAIVKYADRVWR